MLARHRRTVALAACAALGTAPLFVVACGSPSLVSNAGTTGAGGATTKHDGGTGGVTHASSTTSSSSGAGATGGAGGVDAAGGASASSASSSSSGAGGATGAGGAPSDAGADADGGGPVTVVLHPNAPPLPGETECTVIEVTNIPEPDFNHLAMCTPIPYATNPPSGGNHWPIWAAYKIYTQAAPREMTVHDLEHGAIVLSYNCSGACPTVVTALTQIFQSEADPICLSMPGPPARMVLTPDPLLATPIAAASWGATYTATCIDLPSLQAFANAHYGQGREDFCTDGQDTEADPPCPDGGDGG